jgi:NTP pyrophosphatase (non-canonical NTP hydrolase)
MNDAINNESDVYQGAIDLWGVDAQIGMMIEECAELIHALQKAQRGRASNVTEELADVEIMCEQMRLIFDPHEIDSIKKKKINRLQEIVKKHKILESERRAPNGKRNY